MRSFKLLSYLLVVMALLIAIPRIAPAQDEPDADTTGHELYGRWIEIDSDNSMATVLEFGYGNLLFLETYFYEENEYTINPTAHEIHFEGDSFGENKTFGYSFEDEDLVFSLDGEPTSRLAQISSPEFAVHDLVGRWEFYTTYDENGDPLPLSMLRFHAGGTMEYFEETGFEMGSYSTAEGELLIEFYPLEGSEDFTTEVYSYNLAEDLLLIELAEGQLELNYDGPPYMDEEMYNAIMNEVTDMEGDSPAAAVPEAITIPETTDDGATESE
jgi:hypothetical protein